MQTIDLADPDVFARGYPHEFFRRKRREEPVFRVESPRVPPYWVLTRYADVRHVSKSPQLFCSGRGVTLQETPQDVEMGQHSMLFMDPPQHARYRKLVSAYFTPRRLAGLEQRIRERVRAILDAVAHKGQCDFVRCIAAELPLQVIAEFLGVPQDRRQVLFDCSNRIIGAEDPEYGVTEDSARQAAIELFGFAHGLAEERLREPKDDLISLLLHSEVDGQKLQPFEFDAFMVLLTNAGNETTRNMTSHGIRLLLEHPDQRRQLQQRPDLLPRAIEEFLRFNPPVLYFSRKATRDTEIRGVPIRAGDKVYLSYPSANRDEDVFPDPDRFDVTRESNEHLAFGIGEHFCLGANLARMQLRAMFEGLLRRFPDLELDGEIRYLRSTLIHGIKEMPVRFTPEA